MEIKRHRITADDIIHLAGTDIEATAMRQVRKNLLTAFDIWEKAVIRGRETDNRAVMQWYQDLLDLKTSAFENIPEVIKKHMSE